MSLTKIKSVDAHSPAQRAGVRPGETLTHINGRPIVDVLDYKFFAYDPRLELTLVAVSYTHLDVYKRQALPDPFEEPGGGCGL